MKILLKWSIVLFLAHTTTQNYDQYRTRDDYIKRDYRNDQDRFGPDEYCYTLDEAPYVKFGSKTPYQFVFGRVSNQHIVPLCTPVQFWSVVIKGTSLPDRMSIQRYKRLQKLLFDIIGNYEEWRSYPDKGRLCVEDYDNLKRWRWNETISEYNSDTLSEQGVDDLICLAKRYQRRLRKLFVPFSKHRFYFEYIDGDKTQDTCMSYIQGLFGVDASKVYSYVRPNPENLSGSNNDNQFSPYSQSSSGSQYSNSYSSNPRGDTFEEEEYENLPLSETMCKTTKQRLDENRNTSAEYQRFKRTFEYMKMVQNVFKKLGFKYPNEPLIDDIYDLCRLEKSWYITRPSPWCAAFTPKQLKLLEYGEDLFYYYRSGYGHEIVNRNLGCGLLKDMYDRFEKTINDGYSEHEGIVHFRDLDTMLRLFVAMGIGKDESTLKAENYYQLNRRRWKLANLAPFSGNLAAVLYQCINQPEKHKVMFLLNEKPVEFPECTAGLCEWRTVKEKFQYIAQECQLDSCERGAANLAIISNTSLIFWVALASIYKFVF